MMYDEDIKIKNGNRQRKKFVDYYNQWREEKFGEKGYFEYRNRFDNVHIISKNMGFIDRLVKNQKIDFKNNKLQVLKDLITKGNQIYDFEVYSDYESLLMLLAISENPITFILNVLI